MALKVTLGRYYSTASLVHGLDPRVKLVAALVFIASCFAIGSLPGLVLATAALLVCVAAARVPVRLLFAQVRPVALFLVFTALFNLFLAGEGHVLVALGSLAIRTGGVWAAFLYSYRFFLLLCAGALLMCTTTPTALCDALERLGRPLERLGVPVAQGALILSIALRFVPILASEADNVIAAQVARGAELEGKGGLAYARACIPLLVPLFASSLRHAENLGRALDARCYTGAAGRTHVHALKLEMRRDGLFALAFAAYLAAQVALAVLA